MPLSHICALARLACMQLVSMSILAAKRGIVCVGCGHSAPGWVRPRADPTTGSWVVSRHGSDDVSKTLWSPSGLHQPAISLGSIRWACLGSSKNGGYETTTTMHSAIDANTQRRPIIQADCANWQRAPVQHQSWLQSNVKCQGVQPDAPGLHSRSDSMQAPECTCTGHNHESTWGMRSSFSAHEQTRQGSGMLSIVLVLLHSRDLPSVATRKT